MNATLPEHPTVATLRARSLVKSPTATPIDADTLRQLCLEAGTDDVGFVELERPALAGERPYILTAFPATRTVISFVCRMNREPIRSPARSLANNQFHHTTDHVNAVGHAIVRALEERGVRALNVTAGFPMEIDRFPGRIWVLSHKTAAEAAGLGRMGIHRNVIHPRFGSFILLGSVLMEAEVTQHAQQIDYNPCLGCKLCVAACPVGAIGADGHFNVSACYTHNYREFMGGFSEWAETVASSRDGRDYRRRVTASESASMWQSLSFGANYKAAYCLAVCPAGEDVAGPFFASKRDFVREIVRPLQEKAETIYVVPGSDAEAHVAKRFPAKVAKQVRNSFRLVQSPSSWSACLWAFNPINPPGSMPSSTLLLPGRKRQQRPSSSATAESKCGPGTASTVISTSWPTRGRGFDFSPGNTASSSLS